MMFVWDAYLRAGLFRRRWLRQLDTMTSDVIQHSHNEVLRGNAFCIDAYRLGQLISNSALGKKSNHV